MSAGPVRIGSLTRGHPNPGGAHTAAVTGSPTAWILDPDVDFAAGETCTVTVYAAQVTDQDTDDPPDAMAIDYAWSFTVAASDICDDPYTAIYQVQGNSASSPLVDTIVSIEGVVVGDFGSRREQCDALPRRAAGRAAQSGQAAGWLPVPSPLRVHDEGAV